MFEEDIEEEEEASSEYMQRVIMPMETLWDQAKEYARENGHEYRSTCGVVGVAPT